MKKIEELMTPECMRIGIAGHVNPDGDCIGSTTALYLYLKRNYPERIIDLYLEIPKASLTQTAGFDAARQDIPSGLVYDLFITCDTSTLDRIGVAGELFAHAAHTAVIDHHISNPGFADVNHIVPDASSACEALADLMDADRMDRTIAQNLYMGIVTDSGVFQYANTSPHTMRTAASLMEFGFDHHELIDRIFNSRTWKENRILGYALQKAERKCGGRIITSYITLEEMNRFDVEKKNLDLIVSQLRLTEGAECAVFLYETEPGTYKASLRSNAFLDVSEAAAVFGGGGHVRAAGCSLSGTPETVLSQITAVLEERLR